MIIAQRRTLGNEAPDKPWEAYSPHNHAPKVTINFCATPAIGSSIFPSGVRGAV